MKRSGIPLCYYPTTLILLDDDESFLQRLKCFIRDPCKVFTSPFEAMHFFKEGKFKSGVKPVISGSTHCFDRNTADTHVDISELHHQLYDESRFDEVSVLIVDYQMPKINGLEIANMYRAHNVEIIMLTGEASPEIGLSALNNEIVSRFLHKVTMNLKTELVKTVKDLQYKHFEDASQMVLSNFAERDVPMPSFLQNPYFAVFFKGLLEKHQIVEYYILDYAGDFILIDEMAKVHYLTVRDEDGYHALFLESQAGYHDEPTDEAGGFLEEIKNKKKMPFLWGLENPPEFVDWPVYPVKMEACDSSPYWYAWIENDQLDRGIDYSKIKFYQP